MDGAIDEDYAAASSEMFFCEYSDTDPAIKLANPQHNPLALQVQQQSMGWQDPVRDDFVGLSYRLINTGMNPPLFDVHVGFMADFDIGQRGAPGAPSDDRAGFWEGIVAAGTGDRVRDLKLSIGYMFDNNGDFGVAEGYVGLVFLGARRIGFDHEANAYASLSNFRMFSGVAPYEQGGEPTNDEQRLQTMAGTGPLSLPPADPITGLRPSLLTTRSDDYRVLLSAGPFDVVEPGDSLAVDFALVIGPGFDGMVEHAAQAMLLYEGEWFDRDADPMTGVDGRETPVCASESAGLIVRINPCDENCDAAPESPECSVTVPEIGCVWINADCELEAYGTRTGVEGREHQVHWYGDTPTAVALEEFRATPSAAGVRLSWSLSTIMLQNATGVFVLRSQSASGPFAPVMSQALSPLRSMVFEDPQVEPGRSYWYRLRVVFADGTEERSQTIRIDTESAPRSVSSLEVAQDDTRTVAIAYWIAGAPVAVHVRVFDVAGREVRSWNEGVREGGAHRIVWDRTSKSGRRVARGVYLVQLQAGDERRTQKLILARP
jgi:hypothetical protein